MTKCKSQVVIENRSPRIYNSKQYTNNQKLKSCELNPFSVVVYFVQFIFNKVEDNLNLFTIRHHPSQ